MRTNASVKSSGFAANTERRNFRRAVFALSLIALAALGRAARADDGEGSDTGLAVSVGYTGDLRATPPVGSRWARRIRICWTSAPPGVRETCFPMPT